jgi:hypothetical protein
MAAIRQTQRPVARITTSFYERICDIACGTVSGSVLPSVEDGASWALIEDESYRLLLDEIDRQGVDVSRSFIHWRDPITLDDCFRNEE